MTCPVLSWISDLFATADELAELRDLAVLDARTIARLRDDNRHLRDHIAITTRSNA